MSGGVDEIFTRTDSSGSFTPFRDALGSTVALVDANGNVQTSYTYDPFGGTSVTGSSNSNEFQYTGRENEGNGLYYYRARYYNPLLGRFISEDPLEFGGGNANFYIYAEDNPIKFIDPSGLKVIVYYWAPQGIPLTRSFQWGHVSMAVDGAAGSAYISWMPIFGRIDKLGNAPVDLSGLSHGYPNVTGLNRDIGIEGGRPETVEIEGLDEKAILEWWQQYKQKDLQFRMAGRNCSNVITDAFRAGGAQTLYNTVPAPWDIYFEAQQIKARGRYWINDYMWSIAPSKP